MSNYRHEYHAGNFADVFKHIMLCLLLQKLLEKPKPFCVFDTHAGSGYYDLRGPAQKTQEFMTGINLLMQTSPMPAFCQPYQSVIRQYNTHSQTGLPVYHYPGSPLLIAHYLRPEDRLLACESHPEALHTLEATTHAYSNIRCSYGDGYKWLNAQLPPQERRGLVFIDPPFEEPDEFKKIIKCLKQVYQKFSYGIYAIWYPIKTRYAIKLFHNALCATGISSILAAEIYLHGLNEPNRLNGCGMIIINPPWKLQESLSQGLPELHQILGSPKIGNSEVKILMR